MRDRMRELPLDAHERLRRSAHPRCLICLRFISVADFKCAWWNEHMHRKDSQQVEEHDGSITKRGVRTLRGWHTRFYPCSTAYDAKMQWIIVGAMLDDVIRVLGHDTPGQTQWGSTYYKFLRTGETMSRTPPKDGNGRAKLPVPEVIPARPAMPQTFEQWRTPQDVAVAIQRLHHALLTGAISYREATAHVGLLKLYFINMMTNGPAAVLPNLRAPLDEES